MNKIVSILNASIALAGISLAHGEEKLKLSSQAFPPNGSIPPRFTCKGANDNPPLAYVGVPNRAKSLALILEDPDAPNGQFTHWLVWNIAPSAGQISEKSLPPGAVQGTNDFGKLGYGGPCPPSGVHRYYFRVLALDRMLELKSGSKRVEFNKAIEGHVLARGETMGRVSH